MIHCVAGLLIGSERRHQASSQYPEKPARALQVPLETDDHRTVISTSSLPIHCPLPSTHTLNYHTSCQHPEKEPVRAQVQLETGDQKTVTCSSSRPTQLPFSSTHKLNYDEAFCEDLMDTASAGASQWQSNDYVTEEPGSSTHNKLQTLSIASMPENVDALSINSAPAILHRTSSSESLCSSWSSFQYETSWPNLSAASYVCHSPDFDDEVFIKTSQTSSIFPNPSPLPSSFHPDTCMEIPRTTPCAPHSFDPYFSSVKRAVDRNNKRHSFYCSSLSSSSISKCSTGTQTHFDSDEALTLHPETKLYAQTNSVGLYKSDHGLWPESEHICTDSPCRTQNNSWSCNSSDNDSVIDDIEDIFYRRKRIASMESDTQTSPRACCVIL